MNTHLRVGVIGGGSTTAITSALAAAAHDVLIVGVADKSTAGPFEDCTEINVLEYTPKQAEPVEDFRPKSNEPSYRQLPRYRKRKRTT